MLAPVNGSRRKAHQQLRHVIFQDHELIYEECPFRDHDRGSRGPGRRENDRARAWGRAGDRGRRPHPRAVQADGFASTQRLVQESRGLHETWRTGVDGGTPDHVVRRLLPDRRERSGDRLVQDVVPVCDRPRDRADRREGVLQMRADHQGARPRRVRLLQESGSPPRGGRRPVLDLQRDLSAGRRR